MIKWVVPIMVCLSVSIFSFLVGWWSCRSKNRLILSSILNITPQAVVCQYIVEDQLNYLISAGICFKDGEKDSVRDNLYCIVLSKFSVVS